MNRREWRNKYYAYLRSPEWTERRDYIIQRATTGNTGCCERCEAELPPGRLTVHHTTYVRIFAEHPDDLIAICHYCHRFIHGKSHLNPMDWPEWLRTEMCNKPWKRKPTTPPPEEYFDQQPLE